MTDTVTVEVTSILGDRIIAVDYVCDDGATGRVDVGLDGSAVIPSGATITGYDLAFRPGAKLIYGRGEFIIDDEGARD